MSTISDFNRIEDCDKIDAQCVDASIEAKLDEAVPTTLKIETSWGDSTVDLLPAIKAGETLTTLYLSPDPNPTCLVYEPERGDNICIDGDDLSRIISMKYLKDVDQSEAPSDGDVYMYNGTTNLFENYDLKSVIGNINTTLQNINAAISNLQNRMTTAEGNITNLLNRMTTVEGAVSNLQTAVANLQNTVTNHGNRITAIENLLAKPAGAPAGATLTWGTINLYSDPNATINSSGAVTSLDKTHGLYTHNLNNTAYGDDILG